MKRNEEQSAAPGSKESSDSSLTALRIRVAELCGCKRYKRPWDGKVFLCLESPGPAWLSTTDEVDVVNSDVPDFPRDLNAAIQLCDVLKEKGWVWRARSEWNGTVTFEFYKAPEFFGHDCNVVVNAPGLSEAIFRAFVAVMEHNLREKRSE